MKNVLSKILYVILALLVLICIFIGMCAVNPDLAKPLKDVAANIAENRKSKTDDLTEDSPAVASFEISVEEETQEPEEEEPEKEKPSFQEYEDKRNLDDVIDEAVLDNSSESEEDNPYKKIVVSSSLQWWEVQWP